MVNFKIQKLDVVVLTFFPTEETGVGGSTFEATAGDVVVTGTNLTALMRNKSAGIEESKYYLADVNTGEIRSIKAILDDNTLILNVPFTANINLGDTTLLPIDGSFKKIELMRDLPTAMELNFLDMPIANYAANISDAVETFDSNGQGIAAMGIMAISNTITAKITQ